MSKDSYLGITREQNSSYKQAGSKFFGYLFPLENQQQLKTKLDELRSLHPTATHICHAYIIGTSKEIQYFTDDGEPANSSGRPILNALLSANLSFIGCAVVRYYGGKKLGIAGLIQSYGQAALDCIEHAEVKELELMDEIQCFIAPDKQYLLYNFLNKNNSLNYHVKGDEFYIRCSQSMTSGLRSDLGKIPTLALRE